MSTSKSQKAGYHHGALRDGLVAAGLAILAEGVDHASLTLREAARRAGVSAMAPYRHFPDKEALLAAVASVGFGRLAEAQREADACPDPVEALIGQGVAYVTFACAEPSLFRLMFSPQLAAKSGDLGVAASASFQLLAGRVRSVVGPDLADPWTLRNWAVAHGLAGLAIDGQLDAVGRPLLDVVEEVIRLDFLPAGHLKTGSASRPS